MDRIIVAIFDTEKKAHEGYKALKKLDAEGDITLYGAAVIEKNAHGKVVVKEEVDEGPLGTAVGLFIGSLIGLLGGPVGVAYGANTGTLVGMLYDLTNLGINEDFLNEVGQNLQPNKVAVIAEVWEEWVMPVDERMEELGGVVFRQAIEEALSTLDIDAMTRKAEIDSLENEYNQITGSEKHKFQAKIDTAKAKLKSSQEHAKEMLENANHKVEEKIKHMQEQLTSVPSKMKNKIKARIDSIQSKHKKRREKMDKAWKLIKEALAA